MISNERQFKVARSALNELKIDFIDFNEIALVESGVDPLVIDAQRASLQSEIERLTKLVDRYESLRSGAVPHLAASGFADIGRVLVEARVASGMNQRELAARLSIKEQQIQRYEQDLYMSASLARLQEIGEALQIDCEVSIDIAPVLAGDSLSVADLSRLPVKEMKRRGWFKNFAHDHDGELRTDAELLGQFLRTASGGSKMAALHRQKVRSGGNVDEYAITAWKARVLQKAREIREDVGKSRSLDPIFLRKLVALSSLPNGPIQAVKMLREYGVIVVFEEHLKSTYLDGAAMLLDGITPVIGLTLRHDRLDNFWFVLMHELAHIICHWERGLKDGFFDDETSPAGDELEREADEFAQNALIPNEVWSNSIVRFARSADQVNAFARKLGIGSAIVAGRIHNERRNYSLFTDLVGRKVVKKLVVDEGLMVT